ncbi:MAG: TIGR04255 family protein [Tepidisphaeraceae bacterium]|jgi:uncharacterized protein (TIGR04255 family)
MALPETDREIYRRNPLAEVTAQLRFSPILRIEAESPAQFQEAIRDRYALYRQVAAAGQLPADVPAPVRNLIQGMGAAAGPVQHLFETEDRKSSVTLSRETLVLKTMAYMSWHEFREQLDRARAAFEDHYRPVSYGRLDLRYVNIIRRSILGLSDVPWGELLNPSIGGELSAREFGDSVDSASRQLHCKLDGENHFLTLKTGIALAEPSIPGGVKERCFLIDSDFHTHQRTEINNVTSTLDTFNRASGNLFRWAIQRKLRDALEPQRAR